MFEKSFLGEKTVRWTPLRGAAVRKEMAQEVRVSQMGGLSKMAARTHSVASVPDNFFL